MAVQRKSGGAGREVFTTLLQLVLGLMAGALICGVWLALKPVTIMDHPPKPDREVTDRHEVIYVRGKPARGAQGTRKFNALLEKTPGEHVWVEEEMNRWFSAAYGPLERVATLDLIGLTFTTQVPAARLVDDTLELGVQMVAEREKSSRVFVAQARGRFLEQGTQQVFIPWKVYLGSCPLPWNLGGRLVFERLRAMFPVPEEVGGAWAAVTAASVVGNRLQFSLGSPAAVAAPAVAAETVPPGPVVSETIAAPTSAPAEDTIEDTPAASTPSGTSAELVPGVPGESVPTTGEPAANEAVPAPASSEPGPAPVQVEPAAISEEPAPTPEEPVSIPEEPLSNTAEPAETPAAPVAEPADVPTVVAEPTPEPAEVVVPETPAAVDDPVPTPAAP